MLIGIDHGYYAIKTRNCSFPAGITPFGDREPYTRQNVLTLNRPRLCRQHKKSPGQEYSVLAGVAQRQRRYSCFALDALVVEKMDIAVNHFICFGEGCRLMAVDALCFENGEEIFCHCIVIWVSTS